MKENSKINFRKITEDDFETVCGFFVNADELFLVNDRGKHPFTPDQLRKLVSKRLDSTVMIENGKIVGFCNFYGLKKGVSIVLGNLIVSPERRGHNLGTTLMEYMFSLAKTQYEVKRIILQVYSENIGALSLYFRLGFAPYSMKPKKNHRGKTAILLNLYLDV